MKTISVATENRVNVPSDLLLVNIIYLNLPGLTIVLFSENNFTATSDTTFNRFIRSLIVFVKQNKVLSSARL